MHLCEEHSLGALGDDSLQCDVLWVVVDDECHVAIQPCNLVLECDPHFGAVADDEAFACSGQHLDLVGCFGAAVSRKACLLIDTVHPDKAQVKAADQIGKRWYLSSEAVLVGNDRLCVGPNTAAWYE